MKIEREAIDYVHLNFALILCSVLKC